MFFVHQRLKTKYLSLDAAAIICGVSRCKYTISMQRYKVFINILLICVHFLQIVALFFLFRPLFVSLTEENAYLCDALR